MSTNDVYAPDSVYGTNPAKKKLNGLTSSMAGFNPAFGFDPNSGVSASGGSSGAFLPANYNFNDLANYEEMRRNQFGNTASSDILNTRNNLSKSLNDYGQKFFAEQNPAVLEDLNSRGLLNSPTAVAQAQAEKLGSIALSNENYLRDFDTSALSARLQAQQDALDSGSNLRSSGLEANIQESQAQREEAMARDLAKQSGRNQLNGALIGAGGSLLGAGLIAHGAAAGTAAAGTAGAGAAGTGAAGAGAGALALPAAGAAAGLGLYEESRKQYAKHGYGKTESKVLAATPLLSSPYVLGKEGLKAAGFGAGKTANGNAIATTASQIQGQQTQLKQLKDALDNGEIDSATYDQYATPLLKQQHQMVQSALGQGSAWATAIKPEWQRSQDMGFVKAVNGQWVSNTGKVIWDPQKGWNA